MFLFYSSIIINFRMCLKPSLCFSRNLHCIYSIYDKEMKYVTIPYHQITFSLDNIPLNFCAGLLYSTRSHSFYLINCFNWGKPLR